MFGFTFANLLCGGQIMNFTPKIASRPLVGAILTITAVVLIGWGSHVASMPVMTNSRTLAVTELSQAHGYVPIVRAVEVVSGPSFQTARSDYYQPVASWYKSKHWWKRNAPIVGGAGGGALIGGLAGGGTGAVIGGAIGAGGGYAYKRYHHHYHHYHPYH
jgi:hypothetical protein